MVAAYADVGAVETEEVEFAAQETMAPDMATSAEAEAAAVGIVVGHIEAVVEY